MAKRDLQEYRCEYGTLRYACENWDEGKRPLIFLHGLGASSSQFTQMTDRLSDHARCILVDLPGHGENLVPDGFAADFDGFANLVISFLRKLEISRALFVGISMGSALALMCALHSPGMSSGQIVIRPSWLAAPAPLHLTLIERCSGWLCAAPISDGLARLEADKSFQEMQADVPLAADSVRALFARPHARAHAPVLAQMFHSAPFRSLTDLGRIKSQTTIVATHADPLHPVAIANATAKAIPNADFRVLPPRYLQPENHQAALADLILEKLDNSHDYQTT